MSQLVSHLRPYLPVTMRSTLDIATGERLNGTANRGGSELSGGTGRRLGLGGKPETTTSPAWASGPGMGDAAADPMDVFAPIRPLDVRSFAGPVIAVTVSAGTHLVCEGQAVGTFFLIQSGRASLLQSDGVIGSLATGDCFGEIDPAQNAPS